MVVGGAYILGYKMRVSRLHIQLESKHGFEQHPQIQTKKNKKHGKSQKVKLQTLATRYF